MQVAVGVPEKHWIDEEASKPSGAWRAEQAVPATHAQGVAVQGPDDPRRDYYGPDHRQSQPPPKQYPHPVSPYPQQYPQRAPQVPYPHPSSRDSAIQSLHRPVHGDDRYRQVVEEQANGLPERFQQMVQPTTEYGTSEDWQLRQSEGAHWDSQRQRPDEEAGWQSAAHGSVSWSETPHENSEGSVIQLQPDAGDAPVLLENGDDTNNELNNAYDETQQVTYDERVRTQETEHYGMHQTESGEIYGDQAQRDETSQQVTSQ